MLYYTEFCLSPCEVPEEKSICIYISGCTNRCKNCHYPALQLHNYGESLGNFFADIIELYHKQASCVCFLGEGRGFPEDQAEVISYAEYAHAKGLKTCLYCGRDTGIESWMYVFDYIKLGSYREELGSLDSKTTNQRLYRKNDENKYEDMTNRFWIEYRQILLFCL